MYNIYIYILVARFISLHILLEARCGSATFLSTQFTLAEAFCGASASLVSVSSSPATDDDDGDVDHPFLDPEDAKALWQRRFGGDPEDEEALDGLW